MSALTPQQVAARRLGGLNRLGASPEKIADAKRDLAEANITAAIEKHVAAAPPLTAEQLERLHRVLDGGAR